jgi:hypothetical protein
MNFSPGATTINTNSLVISSSLPEWLGLLRIIIRKGRMINTLFYENHKVSKPYRGIFKHQYWRTI